MKFLPPWRTTLPALGAGFALSAVLMFLLDAPLWFAMIACGVFGWLWPLPEPVPPLRLCRFCESDEHRHGLDGKCLWCECGISTAIEESVS